MNEFFNDVKFITEFGGYTIFKTVEKEEHLLFYTNGRKSDAKGFYDENGFTVLKGSIVPSKSVTSINQEKRNKLLIEHTSENENNTFRTVIKNVSFSSPSAAADFCIGSSNNGWIVWKAKDGKTLDEVYRK